jgi:hypothetical protein
LISALLLYNKKASRGEALTSTPAGLLIRVRAIEAHDEILGIEPDQPLLKDIRNFAKRWGGGFDA